MQATFFIPSLRSSFKANISRQIFRSSSVIFTNTGRTTALRLKSTKAKKTGTEPTAQSSFNNASSASGIKSSKSPSTVNAGSEPAEPSVLQSSNTGKPLASSGIKPGVSQSTTTRHGKETLTWPQYLTIRRSKRIWQNFAAVPCSILGLAGGAAYFGSLDTDPMKPIFGIDPFMFYGICTAACMGAGYVVGPSLGAALWRLLPSTKKYGSLIDKKDKEFYERIAKNRVDVTLQSPTSPVPDYYGEKIGSLHEYRKWLRDQNKYRRKVVFDEA
ncbi:mitochondrial import protein Pam17-domain-containing protein [Rhodocollybia butyracea]|uniref:Presequence translocated-associated motor subunit PAM17 n=1 Tax=Rhodocollybia butyracea TaxID=206335 RepID=A0A9P5U4B8_9AGAR|nr:mitochondrial import protein Pam17-domain-containing protein [Rhodocollybia butyracea]